VSKRYTQHPTVAFIETEIVCRHWTGSCHRGEPQCWSRTTTDGFTCCLHLFVGVCTSLQLGMQGLVGERQSLRRLKMKNLPDASSQH